ncbi:MAG: hypothetical protein EOL97_15070 [Spirochaetia bacterium]|nr:hypothetical protein [Spirochaetia bacterium]
MILTPIEKIKEIIDFEMGIYYLMLIARKKDNEHLTHSTEKVIRRVVRNELHLENSINELAGIANYDKENNYKLYISLNPRNSLKAYKNLKEQFANWDNEIINNPNIANKILKVDDEWISCLARNPAKKKWFMLDLDDKKKMGQLKNLVEDYHNIHILGEFETQNGYHILFQPCDTRKLMEDINALEINCELKKDDLLCIGYYDKNGK